MPTSDFYPTSRLPSGSKLAERGRDLTFDAGQGKLSPIYGRERELRQIAEILRRRVKRNPVLVGEAGVGKTAIVEALAIHIIQHTVPEWLANKKIIAISLFDIIAQAQNYAFGEYAQRLREVIEELREKPEKDTNGMGRIAFFDEIHVLKEYLHGANFLKSALARGEVQLIGATTLDEYRQYIERDPALERRFAPVLIDEPDPETTRNILVSLRPRFEEFYGVTIGESAISNAVDLSHRYIYDRNQPDKSIELLETACVRVLTLAGDRPSSSNLFIGGGVAVLGHGVTDSPLPPQVSDQHVRMIVAEWTGIPDSSLSGERQKYLELETELRKRIVGQNDAVRSVSKIILANKAGTVTRPQRPNGVFLFVGPTGVGKTELAKALAVSLTGKEDHLVVLDMTAYRESYTIASLVGMPRGNYSTPELPTLTKLVRDHPFGVLLLDEIEKSHPELWSLFMQVFEEGKLVDRQGTTVHFTDMVVIMTANVDVVSRVNERFRREKTKRSSEAGAGDAQVWREIYCDEALRFVKEETKFPREFLNRMDEVVIFYPLAQANLESILRMHLADLETRIEVKLNLSPAAFQLLLKRGNRPEYGARELRRSLDTYLGTQLATMKLKADTDAWKYVSAIDVDVDANGINLILEPQISPGLRREGHSQGDDL